MQIDLTDLITAAGAGVVAIFTGIFGSRLGKQRAQDSALAITQQTAEAAIARCEQLNKDMDAKVARFETASAEAHDTIVQLLELNRYALRDNEALRARVSELEVKVHALETELKNRINAKA